MKRHKAECFFNSSCPRARNIKCLCYSQSKNRLHTRKPLYFVTSIVGTGNREGKFEWRLQSALGCDELKVILLFVKAYLQKIIRIIRGNVYHAYMHLSGYFCVIWKAVTLLIL